MFSINLLFLYFLFAMEFQLVWLTFAAWKRIQMAGQLKEVRNRIKSVQSTQQITKAMKMVSAAKLRRAQDAITQMRPYANKLQDMLSNIVGSLEGDINLANLDEIETVMNGDLTGRLKR